MRNITLLAAMCGAMGTATAACAAAPIEYHGDKFYGVNGPRLMADIRERLEIGADTTTLEEPANFVRYEGKNAAPYVSVGVKDLSMGGLPARPPLRDMPEVEISRPLPNDPELAKELADAPIPSKAGQEYAALSDTAKPGNVSFDENPETAIVAYGTQTKGSIALQKPQPAKVEVKAQAKPEPKLAEHKPPQEKPVLVKAAPLETDSRMSFIKPVYGEVISPFGSKQNGKQNDGVNIAAPLGTPIRAVAGGEVVYAGNELKGYGNMIIIRHDNGWMSAYAHADSMRVVADQKVAQGTIIGAVGKTGNVSESQLHFGLRKGNAAVDPSKHLQTTFAAVR
jgi:murein DD-endopeptidase MepM/ murein hydrolase activator NlpD